MSLRGGTPVFGPPHGNVRQTPPASEHAREHAVPARGPFARHRLSANTRGRRGWAVGPWLRARSSSRVRPSWTTPGSIASRRTWTRGRSRAPAAGWGSKGARSTRAASSSTCARAGWPATCSSPRRPEARWSRCAPTGRVTSRPRPPPASSARRACRSSTWRPCCGPSEPEPLAVAAIRTVRARHDFPLMALAGLPAVLGGAAMGGGDLPRGRSGAQPHRHGDPGPVPLLALYGADERDPLRPGPGRHPSATGSLACPARGPREAPRHRRRLGPAPSRVPGRFRRRSERGRERGAPRPPGEVRGAGPRRLRVARPGPHLRRRPATAASSARSACRSSPPPRPAQSAGVDVPGEGGGDG